MMMMKIPTVSHLRAIIIVVVVAISSIIFLQVQALSLKPVENRNDSKTKPIRSLFGTSRRQVLARIFVGAGAGFGSAFCCDGSATATCLLGDDSVDCIGVYKEPIPPPTSDNSIGEVVRMSYGPFRPDRLPIVLHNPTSYQEAIGMLQDQRYAYDDIEHLVNVGRFEDAGQQLLRVLPKIKLAGRYVTNTNPFIDKFLEIAEKTASTADVTIGQYMKGKFRVATAAQIQILSDLTLARTALDDLIKNVSSLS